MVKGVGMFVFGFVMMFVVIMMDVVLELFQVDVVLCCVMGRIFDCFDFDGCMLINDQVILFVNGVFEVVFDLDDFVVVFIELCQDLVVQLQGDVEGVSYDIMIEVQQVVLEQEVVEVGWFVVWNNLFKVVIFGNDLNWGCVFVVIGIISVQFDFYDVDVWMNGVCVCIVGGFDCFWEEVDLILCVMYFVIDLKVGDVIVMVFINDFIYDYVYENSVYVL